MPRPNVAPRPVCRYYSTPRGCFAGQRCHYLHADPTYAPYEQNKTCRFFARGFCKRGNECWFVHSAGERASEQVSNGDAEEVEACGICFEERPALYGLLSGCSHAFCLSCIRQWRDPEGKGVDMQESATHKTCPMCRNMTSFITPSGMYYAQDDPRKKDAIQQYKQSMARVPCRYFARSKPEKRFCPFGRDCFYQHLNSDGTPYKFADGVDLMMAQWRRRRNDAETFLSELQDPLEAALQVLEGIAGTLPEERDTDAPAEGARSLTRRTMLELHSFMMRYMNHQQEAEEQAPDVAGNEEPGTSSVASGDISRPATPSPVTPTPPSDEAPRSDDPRSPANTSRSGQLVSGDFAWMMGGQTDESCGAASGDAQ